MHDYLATDGDSSVRSHADEHDSRRHVYTGYRDKNKVKDNPNHRNGLVWLMVHNVENVQVVR